MKTVKYINESNAWMVEPGDRLHFHAPDHFRSDWGGERDFDITVRETFLKSIHGPRIFSVEKIRAVPEDELDEWPECMRTEDDWCLVDDWVITVLPPTSPEEGN